MVIESTLTDHIIALREKVARMESDVRHLAHEQGVHTGSLAVTDSRLAHIAQSCRDAHLLIQRIQTDVTALGKRSRLADVLKEWAPVLTPALIGSLVLLLTLLGKSDLAAKLATVK
jgi:hypothetical protein